LSPRSVSLRTPPLLQRTAAYALDLGVATLLSVGLSLVLIPAWLSMSLIAQGTAEPSLLEAAQRAQTGLERLFLLTFPVVYALYFSITTAGLRSTWGKRLLGLQVVSLNEERLKPLQCLIRELARPVDLLFSPLLLTWGSQRHTLGDRLAGTRVVLARKARCFERLVLASSFRSLYVHLQPRWVENTFCEFYLGLYSGDWTPQTLRDLEQMARTSLVNARAPIPQEELVHFFAEFCQQTLEQRRKEIKVS
jgi:uncharacterized RDD family membrane protein YckC